MQYIWFAHIALYNCNKMYHGTMIAFWYFAIHTDSMFTAVKLLILMIAHTQHVSFLFICCSLQSQLEGSLCTAHVVLHILPKWLPRAHLLLLLQ